MYNRKLLSQRLANTYKNDISIQNYICFYCGAPADTIDHCPPLSIVDTYLHYDRVLLRCCSLCNSLLSHRVLLTPLARCEYLKERYSKRWRKDIEMPYWADDEIEELEGELKREVIKGMKRKERANLVLKNIEMRINIFLESIQN